jgi:hypothetical protein
MEPAKMPKQCQKEEKEHEQEQQHMNGHTNPRCLKEWQGQFPDHKESRKGLSSEREKSPNYPPS